MRCVHRERDVDNRTLGVEPAIFGAHPSRSGACGSNDTLGARAVARLRRSFRVHEPAYARSLGPAKLWRNNRFFVGKRKFESLGYSIIIFAVDQCAPANLGGALAQW